MSELLPLSLLFIGLLIFLYLLGIPVAYAMGLTILGVMLSPFYGGVELTPISNQLLFGLNDFSLLAVPFYLFLGRLMNRTGMTSEIFAFANSLVGQFRGGIAYVNVVASMIFSGMSGAAVADAAGLGRIEYTAMREHGYDKDISLGVTGSSAIIGPIIPPSVMMIIYGLLAGQSIGTLFIAGIVPGIILGLTLMAFTYLLLRYRGFEGTSEQMERDRVVETFVDAFPALLIPAIIIVGILSGFFTATEAGAVGVVYTAAIGFVFGDLTLGSLVTELRDSSVETFSILFIVAIAAIYGLLALQLRIPMMLADTITGFSQDPLVVMMLIIAIFLIVGMFMEGIAAITVLIPILFPVVEQFAIDPIHFGVVVVLAVYVGALTPPFGIILFVLDQVTDAKLQEVIRGVVPFYIPIFVTLFLCLLIPGIVTYLPSVVG